MSTVEIDVPPPGTLRILTDGENIRIVLPAYATWVEITPDQANHIAAALFHLTDLIAVVSDNPSVLSAKVDLKAKVKHLDEVMTVSSSDVEVLGEPTWVKVTRNKLAKESLEEAQRCAALCFLQYLEADDIPVPVVGRIEVPVESLGGKHVWCANFTWIHQYSSEWNGIAVAPVSAGRYLGGGYVQIVIASRPLWFGFDHRPVVTARSALPVIFRDYQV